MASAEQIKALLKSHLEGDEVRFLSVAMQVAAHEAKLGHGKLAENLRDIVDATKSRNQTFELSKKRIVVNKSNGELSGLLDVSYPKTRLTDMILDDGVSEKLQKVIKEQQFFTKLKEFGLSPQRKLLLVGLPGTGKTMTAEVLAGELGIPLFLVRLDTLITKYMGETAAKLRQVFDSIREVRGVYFFDEFDAIGSQRGLANDVGEIRRVLNSFLQMIEQDHSNSVIIAATNHPDILDYALFRRFDNVIQYDIPNQAQVALMLKNRLAGFQPKRFSWSKVSAKAVGLSYAEIAKVIDETIKNCIIHDSGLITESELVQIIEARKLMSYKFINKNNNERPIHAESNPR